MISLVVGLDLAKRSIGMAMFHPETDTWKMCAFAKHKTEKAKAGLCYKDEKNEILLFPEIPEEQNDVQQYVFIEGQLMNALRDTMKSFEIQPHEVHVLMEGYVFSPTKFGNNYKLHEIGGIMKRSFYVNGFEHFDVVQPSSWKSKLLKGNADKNDVIEHIRCNGPCLDILAILGQKKNTRGTIPKPSQDLADACGIILAYYRNIEYNTDGNDDSNNDSNDDSNDDTNFER